MKRNGFTLIELMVVVAIIGILATVSLPKYQSYIYRSEAVEALAMASALKEDITKQYAENLAFPLDNRAAGLPAPQQLLGNRITSVSIEEGVIHITLGNKASKPLQGKVLSFRPAVVVDSPVSPIAWLCGYSEAVQGMAGVGQNKTNVDSSYLPSACRR